MALIGLTVARTLHAIKGKVIVINMLIVKEAYCVVLTIAPEDHHILTAALVGQILTRFLMFASPFGWPVK